MLQTILFVLLAVVISGFLVWLVDRLPIDATMKIIFKFVVVIALIWWILVVFGFVGSFHGFK